MPGRAIYDAHCAACHNGAVEKAPHRLMIELMTPEAIAATLNTGLMSEQGELLTATERVQVAEYLANKTMGSEPAPLAMCGEDRAGFDMDRPPAVSGWGLQPANTRMLAASVAGVWPRRRPAGDRSDAGGHLAVAAIGLGAA